MTAQVCFVSYHELGLKGNNRSVFENRLLDNINYALRGFQVGRARKIAGRITVDLHDYEPAQQIADRIALLPGITSVAIAARVGRDMTEICSTALKVARASGQFSTFKVAAKRANTDFPLTSMEINQVVGHYLDERLDARVQLSRPDLTVSVVVVGGFTYIYGGRTPGVGGLPAGSSNKLISLLSSGLDSPVATWRMLRRGAVTVGLHFSGRPEINDSSERLVYQIGEVLSLTGGLGRIYTVPFGKIQREISSTVFPDLRILMYRRVMICVAEELARIEKGKALVTGESLGQVASQTLDNIRVVDDVATLPIFRPLIGNDKQEIVRETQRINTYEISIQDAEDCCTLFMPRTPETHANLEVVREAWTALDVDTMVRQCIEDIEWVDYPSNRYKPPRQFPRHAKS